jgi:hypothetical protein
MEQVVWHLFCMFSSSLPCGSTCPILKIWYRMSKTDVSEVLLILLNDKSKRKSVPQNISFYVISPVMPIFLRSVRLFRAVISQSVKRRATGWTIGVLGFDSLRVLRSSLFTTTSRPSLGPTQSPIQ